MTIPVLCFWVSDWGIYEVPEELRDVRIAKTTHWPDRRFKKDCARYMAWVEEQDKKAREEFYNDQSI